MVAKTRINILLGLLLISPLGWAADAHPGKELHDENCTRCHDSSVYTRAERKVTSLQGLHNQVRRCDSMLELRLFDDDIENIVQYLNTQYYQFK